MIHRQAELPTKAQIGDAWVDPQGTFKRVLSRGGAWENVNLGSKHPDEVDHGSEQQRPEAEQQNVSANVSAGTDPVSPGDGNDGEVSGTEQGLEGTEDTFVVGPPATDDELKKAAQALADSEVVAAEPSGFEEGGVDGNGSPVV